MTENWLSVQPDNNNKKLVKIMHCKLCHEYENEICRLPQFNYTGSNNGCVHLQLSVTVEHETGGPHKAAYNKFLTKRDWDLENELQKYTDGKKLDKCFL